MPILSTIGDKAAAAIAASQKQYALNTVSASGKRLLGSSFQIRKIGSQDVIDLEAPVWSSKMKVEVTGYGMEAERVNFAKLSRVRNIDPQGVYRQSWQLLDDLANVVPRSVRITYRGAVLGQNLNDIVISWVDRAGVAHHRALQEVMSLLHDAKERLSASVEPDVSRQDTIPAAFFVPTNYPPGNVNTWPINAIYTNPAAPVQHPAPARFGHLMFIPGMARSAVYAQGTSISPMTYACNQLDMDFARAALAIMLGFYQSDLLSFTTGPNGAINPAAHSLWALSRYPDQTQHLMIFDDQFNPNKVIGGTIRFAMSDFIHSVQILRQLMSYAVGDLSVYDWVSNDPDVLNPIPEDMVNAFLYVVNTNSARVVYDVMNQARTEAEIFLKYLQDRIRKRKPSFVIKTPNGTDVLKTIENSGMGGAAELLFDFQPIRWASPVLYFPGMTVFDGFEVDVWFVTNGGTPYYLNGLGATPVRVQPNMNTSYFTNNMQWNKQNTLAVSVERSHYIRKWKDGIKIEGNMKYYAPGSITDTSTHVYTTVDTSKGYSWLVPNSLSAFLDQEVPASIGSIQLS